MNTKTVLAAFLTQCIFPSRILGTENSIEKVLFKLNVLTGANAETVLSSLGGLPTLDGFLETVLFAICSLNELRVCTLV